MLSFAPTGLLTLYFSGYIHKWIYIGVYATLQIFMYLFPAYLVRSLELPIASAAIIMCEQTRMCMKMHSFVRETWTQVKNTEAAQAGSPKITLPSGKVDENAYLIEDSNKRFRAYFFFLFCPTLLFRNRYPRNSSIRWDFFILRTSELVGCIFYTYVLFKKWCVPQFERTAVHPGDVRTLIASIFTSTVCTSCPLFFISPVSFFPIFRHFCTHTVSHSLPPSLAPSLPPPLLPTSCQEFSCYFSAFSASSIRG